MSKEDLIKKLEFENTLILDFGTHSTKFGVKSSPFPEFQRSVLGIERNLVEEEEEEKKFNHENPYHFTNFRKDVGVNYHSNETNILEKCEDVCKVFRERGLIKNYHHFEILIEELVSKNQQKLNNCRDESLEDYFKRTPIEIVESMLTPKNQRAKVLGMFFENFEVPAIHFGDSILSSLCFYDKAKYNTELVIVVDIGSEQIKICPVLEGNNLLSKTGILSYGGNDISDGLIGLLPVFNSVESSKSKAWFQKHLITDRMKERFCYFSQNIVHDRRCAKNRLFSLFDLYKPLFVIFPVEIIHLFHQFAYGTQKMYRERTFSFDPQIIEHQPIILREDQFEVPELYFSRPSLRGNKLKKLGEMLNWESVSDKYGLVEALEKVIMKTELLVSFQNTVGSNLVKEKKVKKIYFCGGGSLVRNFRERVDLEVQKSKMFENIELGFHQDRGVSAWLGSKYLIDMEGIRNSFITSEEYDEAGETLVHRKSLT